MSQLKKGAFLSYITIILTNGIGLLLTPFMISKLGDSEYGLYTLIGSLIGYISVLDFGLNNTIIRFVAKYRAKQDRKSEENFLATSMLIYGVIAGIILIAGVALYMNIESVFEKLTAEELAKAKIMFAILILNLAITLPGGAFGAVCSAYEHFIFPRAVNIIKYVSRSMMIIGLLLYGGKSVSIVILDTVINIIVIAIDFYYVIKVLKVRFHLHHFNKPLIREIFSYSVWIFIFAIVGQFQWRAGQIILGVVSGTTAVAIYGVGIMLGTYYGAFSTAISGVFLPRATQMAVLDASRDELTSMMIRIGRFSLITLLMILGGFLLYGRQFVHLWIGDTYKNSWLIAIIIMFSYTLPLVQSFANSLLEAKSKFSFKAITYISLIVLGTAVGAYMIRFWGVIGLIVGSTSGWLLSQVIMNIYYYKVMHLDILRFFKELSSRLLPTFIVILALGYAVDFIPGANWFNLLIKISAFVCIFSLLMYKFGMNESELKIIKDSIPSFLRKK
ncbi:teichoic acid transporter [Flavobacterium noncentrifugens]|uniref:Membrane protein involved in the export of O-antigen and teichoic acid n=1 Tax=Flavobacterium noncentrifugens TaxID=1128970 RepID=A0A1G8V7B4_9FLAO|nr:oligosaccharide flippase family protein [Flavobacterium noncentrifugens]GEP50373.1 teichoic acid transporter [Flavobacterium noncentrifugens]SDJ61968.1 Membrane protein involved in the export of O-antigen and teichoic acid [Flavobacterium noncentrifugens]